jgi:hypothetical protein
MNDLKVGDTVLWRGGFGSDPAKPAKVTHIEIVKLGQKEGGVEVQDVPWGIVRDYVVVSLDNGHWAYGRQLTEVLPGQEMGEV